MAKLTFFCKFSVKKYRSVNALNPRDIFDQKLILKITVEGLIHTDFCSVPLFDSLNRNTEVRPEIGNKQSFKSYSKNSFFPYICKKVSKLEINSTTFDE